MTVMETVDTRINMQLCTWTDCLLIFGYLQFNYKPIYGNMWQDNYF